MLNDFIKYMQFYRKSALTIDSYVFTIKKFFAADDITPEMIKAVTPQQFQDYIMAISDSGVKPSTINQRISALKTFFLWCQKQAKVIDTSPAQDVSLIRVPSRAPKYFTVKEIEDIFDSVSKRNYERDMLVLLLISLAGLRRCEVIGLNLSDVGEQLHIIGKGNKERFIPINDTLKEALRQYLKKRPKTTDNALLLGSDGKRIKATTIRSITDSIQRKTGLEVHPHKFRHTAATMAYAETKDVLAVKELLGHTRLETTLIYTHVLDKEKEKIVNANPINDILRK